MPTLTDTDALSLSFATPEEFQEAAQKTVNVWVGAASPLWAPFWAAASFGVGIWAVSQGFTRTLGGTLYDKDISLVAKWPGFMAPPAPQQLIEKAAEVLEAPVELAEQAISPAIETVEIVETAAFETVESAIEAVSEPAEVIAEASEDTLAAFEPNPAVVGDDTKAEAVENERLAKAREDAIAAFAPVIEDETSTNLVADDAKPLIDPVTEAPVIPAVAKALAEPKLPMPNPRKNRKR